MQDNYFVYNEVDYKDEFAQSLKKCEELITKTSNDPDVNIFFYPHVKGTRTRRNCKEQIYKLAGQLARDHQLHGNMISLAAAYGLDIMKEFHSVVSECFINCERDKHSYLQLCEFYYKLRNDLQWWKKIEDKSDLNKLVMVKADIFDILDSARQVKDIAVVDLDLMQRLDTSLVDKIYSSLAKPGLHKDRFLLAVWSTYGRSCTEDFYDSKARPYLLQKFVMERGARYNLIDYRTFKYCDNHIPLKVELLVLENRK